jgi:hypothetical protein
MISFIVFGPRLRWKQVIEYQEFELEEGCCVTKFRVDVVLYCCPCVSMDTCLSPNCFNVSMVTEGNCFVVYNMYENVVQSSLNLRSEQRFYFISPYHENPLKSTITTQESL